MRSSRWILPILVLAILAPPAAANGTAGLRERIERFVRSRLSPPPLRMEVPSLEAFRLPGIDPDRVEVQLDAHAEAFAGTSFPVTVVLRVDGEEVKRGVVTVQVEARARVLVADRALPRGTRVRAEDIRSEWRPRSSLPPGRVDDPKRLVGRRTTRSVPAGAPWRSDLVRDAPAVTRGQVVRLELHHGALRIEATGKARDDGRAGDRVRVLNLDSRREVVGRVGDDGAVHVSF